MSNNWTIRLGKNVLATQKKSIESNFVRIIHNEFIPLSAEVKICDFQNIGFMANEYLKLIFEKKFNFKINIIITFSSKIIMPIYVVKTKTIIVPIKLILLKNSNNLIDQEVFFFFLYHEIGHAFLDQNRPSIYKFKKIKSIFTYLCNKYSLVELSIEDKILSLNVQQVYKEFLPDFIAMMLLQKNFPSLFNKDWKAFFASFNYFKTDEEIISIFNKDPHAIIEARIFISKQAVEYFNYLLL
ncbi:hypothetical protein [Lactobacillus helveticus]|nr:hypothetical protein [Lactobacillus helveticus]AYE61927.1 hypothetical protein BC335_1505 [Lactobacillus helveticus]MCD9224863.1 hypothetical protein [Lactobacillus helveticus]GFP10745.1 hypothetical protein LHEJCM1007_08540 [Lactobacillus helveticus]GFP13520.1 hypothetical protein LHEJCM1062_13920 [Lactobacillus helveticus]